MKKLFLILFFTTLYIHTEDLNTPDIDSSLVDLHQYLSSHELEMQKDTVDLMLVEHILKNPSANLKRLLLMLEDIEKYQAVIPKTILLIGAPGLGKSTLTRGIAVKYGIPYTFIECPLLANEYKNSGPQNLHRQLAQSYLKQDTRIIILDEIGAIVDESTNKQENDKDTITAFLSVVDKLQQQNPYAIIIATTNSIEKFPEPVKSRFQECIELHLPSLKTRMEIIKFHLQKKNTTCNPKLLRIIAQKTQNFSGRDLSHATKIMVSYALMRTKERKQLVLHKKDVIQAFKEINRNKMFENITQSYIMRAYKYLKKNNSQIIPGLSLVCTTIGLVLQYKGIQLQQESLGVSKEGLEIQKDSNWWQKFGIGVSAIQTALLVVGGIIAGGSAMAINFGWMSAPVTKVAIVAGAA